MTEQSWRLAVVSPLGARFGLHFAAVDPAGIGARATGSLKERFLELLAQAMADDIDCRAWTTVRASGRLEDSHRHLAEFGAALSDRLNELHAERQQAVASQSGADLIASLEVIDARTKTTGAGLDGAKAAVEEQRLVYSRLRQAAEAAMRRLFQQVKTQMMAEILRERSDLEQRLTQAASPHLTGLLDLNQRAQLLQGSTIRDTLTAELLGDVPTTGAVEPALAGT
jgi:hypothetical protein